MKVLAGNIARGRTPLDTVTPFGYNADMPTAICPQCFGRGHLIDDREEGAMLRTIRQRVGLRQEDVARRVQCSISYICDIEQGRRHCSMKVRQAYLDIVLMSDGVD